MKTSKKVICLLLTLIMVVSSLPMAAIEAEAASFPYVSGYNYIEFKSDKYINCYTSSSRSTRGTSSPWSAYTAYIEPGDVCYIYEITGSYIYLSYPTKSGYKKAYVNRTDIFPSYPQYIYTASTNSDVYWKTNRSYKYGCVERYDKVYVISYNWVYNSGYGWEQYAKVIYTARNYSRAYKYGYIKI